jgi:EAL domain-containing protein (putative c-di-GMP-specific phosphodiesterase class I)
MPDVDGVELLRVLESRRCAAQILIISGAGAKVVDSAERIGRERGLNVIGTVLKPFRVKDIKARLDELKDKGEALSISALRRAIEEEELFLAYQPKIEFPSLGIVGFEALVRWEHPMRGTLPPADFMPLAEQGLADELTRAVLTMGLKQSAAWAEEGRVAAVALNISGRNLNDVHFADSVIDLCRDYAVPPDRLTLELTETAATEHALEAMDILTRLRIKGVNLSIDDFGTGYSSLVQLHRLPFTDVKIDKEFVSNCHSSRDSLAIVKTIIDLGHNLGMKAVAEGVENAEVLHILADLGCDGAQGYHISRPIPAAEAAKFAAAWHPGGRSAARPAAK